MLLSPGLCIAVRKPFRPGNAAHATQFLVPFALGGLLLLLKAIDQRKTWMLIASGLLLGSAFMVKQHAVFFVLFAILYYFSRTAKMPVPMRETVSKTAILTVSSALPFLVACGLLYIAGVFPTFCRPRARAHPPGRAPRPC